MWLLADAHASYRMLFPEKFESSSATTVNLHTHTMGNMQLKLSALGWICLSVAIFMLVTACLAWIYCLWQGCCRNPKTHVAAADGSRRHRKFQELRLDLGGIGDVLAVDDETAWSILSTPTPDTPLLPPSTSSALPPAACTAHRSRDTWQQPQSPQDTSIQRYLRLEAQECAFRIHLMTARTSQQSRIAHPGSTPQPVHKLCNTSSAARACSSRVACSPPQRPASRMLGDNTFNSSALGTVDHTQRMPPQLVQYHQPTVQPVLDACSCLRGDGAERAIVPKQLGSREYQGCEARGSAHAALQQQSCIPPNHEAVGLQTTPLGQEVLQLSSADPDPQAIKADVL